MTGGVNSAADDLHALDTGTPQHEVQKSQPGDVYFSFASASDWTASVCKALCASGSDLCGDIEFPLQLHLPLTQVVVRVT